MSEPLAFAAVARIPSPGDNVAVATRRIEAGSRIDVAGVERTLAHTVLEGHRFAVEPIAEGQDLRSWGMPFGTAVRAIAPGEYVSNQLTVEGLAKRNVAGAVLPTSGNFENQIIPFAFDPAAFRPAEQVAPAADLAERTFLGFPRTHGRGVGTRNYVVILGTTSRTGSFARQLAERLQGLARIYPALDGIVPIAHTEGEAARPPNNLAELLRTLAGFMVNPNVAAVLAVDYGTEAVSNEVLRSFMVAQGYPLDSLPHAFFTISGSLNAAMGRAEEIVRGWLPQVGTQARVPTPLSALRIGLQCGGSDAFSGVSSNPLLGWVSREVVRYGGAVNLAETDEQVGAESYILAKVRDVPTAQRFLAAIARFKERLGWHGATVEGNPSAGNRFRGLYNIVLKSLGAAMKKHPDLRLDHVIDYAEPMRAPGFFFMDSPGNDLESIAGQVGAGCNLIFFSTGNGSVTNFPFVPTVKVTSTTRRHLLLEHEMDVNAGAFLDGQSMDEVGRAMFELVGEIASGRRSKGERAGHSQVSIWRNWPQADASHLAELKARAVPDGEPLPLPTPVPAVPAAAFPAYATADGKWAADRIGLIVPASMCSSQIARMAAQRLNASGLGAAHGISRFAALPHTEGCGFTGEQMYALLQRTYRGYAVHPSVAATLFLEHGCEKIPNDFIRRYLVEQDTDPARYGWASVQLDGGIDKVLAKVDAWFGAQLAAQPAPARRLTDLGGLALGLATTAAVTATTADALGVLARAIVAQGGSVLVAESDRLLGNAAFRARTLGATAPRATLLYGEAMAESGFHVVATETEHWVENLTGLAACGAQQVLAVVRGEARQGHPFVPLLQVAEAGATGGVAAEDLDGTLTGDAAADFLTLQGLVVAMAAGTLVPASAKHGFTDFQLTRGLLGVST